MTRTQMEQVAQEMTDLIEERADELGVALNFYGVYTDLLSRLEASNDIEGEE